MVREPKLDHLGAREAARSYLTPAEVGRIVGVAPTTVTRWAREGKLPCLVTLGGHRRFDPDVVEILKRNLARGPEEETSVESQFPKAGRDGEDPSAD